MAKAHRAEILPSEESYLMTPTTLIEQELSTAQATEQDVYPPLPIRLTAERHASGARCFKRVAWKRLLAFNFATGIVELPLACIAIVPRQEILCRLGHRTGEKMRIYLRSLKDEFHQLINILKYKHIARYDRRTALPALNVFA